MKSFDVWDTILGRWYYTPESIFDQMAIATSIPEFTWKRKHAERLSNIKTLDQIYSTFCSLFGYPQTYGGFLHDLEIEYEIKNSFRINTTLTDMKSDSIVVSDFYLHPDELASVLAHHNIVPYRIYTSYDGKQSGSVWSKIKEPIEIHIGDNYQSDYESAIKNGIPAQHINFTRFNGVESWLYGQEGMANLACLCRATRLGSTRLFDSYGLVYSEFSSIQLPILILLTKAIHELCERIGFSKILFTSRDCHYLRLFMNQIYPFYNNQIFYTSREAYNTSSPEFIDYVKSIYTPSTLIVDLQGTGDTCFRFFEKNLGVTPNYFTVVDSDRHELKRPSKYSIVSWKDGYTDRIERMNYINRSRAIDVVRGEPIIFYQEPNMHVEQHELATMRASNFLYNGFRLNLGDNWFGILLKLLRYMEDNPLEIIKHVNHEEF